MLNSESELLFINAVALLHFGVAVLLLYQALINLVLNLKLRSVSSNKLCYVWLALASATYAFIVFIEIYFRNVELNKHICFFAAASGFWVMATYIEALKKYTEDKTKKLHFAKNLAFVMAGTTLFFYAIFLLTGNPVFLDFVPQDSRNLFTRAVGGFYSPNMVSGVFALVIIIVNTYTAGHFIRRVYRTEPRDWLLIGGMVFSLLAIVNEFIMTLVDNPFVFPVMAFANVLEVLRITYMTQMKVGLEVGKLQSQLALSDRFSKVGLSYAKLGHEVNTVATICNLSIDEIKKQVEAEVTNKKEVNVMLGLIGDQLARVSKLCKTIGLSVRQPSTAGPINIELNRAAERAVQFMDFYASSEKVSLTISPASQDIFICSDADHLQQVLVNLLKNGIEAARQTPGAHVSIAVFANKDSAEVKVTDSGHGVEPEILTKLFKSPITTKKSTEGTGLGLRISYQLIKRSGGDLYYDATSPKTCFIVRLPILASA